VAHARASNKDIGRLLRRLEQQGWTVTGGGNRHFKAACPRRCRCLAIFSSSASAPFAVRRATMHLRTNTCWKEPTR